MKEALAAFISSARWFGGKGRDFEVTATRRLRLADRVAVELVTLTYGDGDTDLYQLPLSFHTESRSALDHALVGAWDDAELGHVHVYDALHDHDAAPLWLRAFVDAPDATTGDHDAGPDTGPGLTFHRVGSPELDSEARSAVLTGEQSNTSVAFGDQSLMKLFRRVTPGQNPDIEILAALTDAGNEHVAALYGWVDTELDGELLQLGILQQFLTTASDGWALALASLRTLHGGLDESARDSGGDFAAEAGRLGAAVAQMHTSLASAFPTESWDGTRLGQLADDMSGRLDAAARVVPELAAHAAGLHALFDAVRQLDAPGSAPVTAQRVHGDLHLGQTLRTAKNWKIIDFEGEPAKPLSERRRPDSAWRDVAGMLRSFDYAAESSLVDQEAPETDATARARDWAERNVRAFLTGYQDASGAELNQTLLTAYAADKAVYEAVYEARNRPTWLPIPLAALARLTDDT